MRYLINRNLGSASLLATIALLFLFSVLTPRLCAAQVDDPQSKLPPIEGHRSPDEAAWEAKQRKAMAKKANLQRQEDIKKDTEKLLELATELKHYVDKTDENTLSLDVIKKAEQIEKLAKSVKEKMKGP